MTPFVEFVEALWTVCLDRFEAHPRAARLGGAAGVIVGASGMNPDVGRWPANVALDEEAAAILDNQAGERKSPEPYLRASGSNSQSVYQRMRSRDGEVNASYGDSGGASRFFYTAKASTSERQERARAAGLSNQHPTVKPIDLMRWLCRLVTPPGGTILDPFAGSGTTLVAALMEGFESVGVERDESYAAIARARIDGVQLGGLF